MQEPRPNMALPIVNRTPAHKDPVCGMTVVPARAAASIEHDGHAYFFCSKGCAAKFANGPEKFLAAANEPATTLRASHHPESTGAAKQSEASAIRYTCPMHPEITQIGPGSCPKCGMALEPMDVFAE